MPVQFVLFLYFLLSLAGCSLIANVDDFELDTDDEVDPGSVCIDDSDCGDNGICPKIINAFESDGSEIESYCYRDCNDDEAVCNGTSQPNCYRFGLGAFCLSKILVNGNFKCYQRGEKPAVPRDTSVTVTFTQEETTVSLDQCEYWVENQVFNLFLHSIANRSFNYLILSWPNSIASRTIIKDAEGTFIALTTNQSGGLEEVQTKGFFPSQEGGTVEIDNLSASIGSSIRGNLSKTGYAYRALLNPSLFPEKPKE